MNFMKTKGAAAYLGVSYWRLINLVRFGKIAPPAKDASGDFLWLEGDLERARKAFAAMDKTRQPEPATANA
jgi:hypothetical protein